MIRAVLGAMFGAWLALAGLAGLTYLVLILLGWHGVVAVIGGALYLLDVGRRAW